MNPAPSLPDSPLPAAPPDIRPTPPNALGRRLAKLGGLMQLAPLIGMAGTVKGMVQAFDALGSTGEAADPALLSQGIGNALLYTAIGIPIALAGWVLLLTSIFAFRYRPSWIFWLIVIEAALITQFSPVGKVVGLIVLALVIVFRAEFFARATDTKG